MADQEESKDGAATKETLALDSTKQKEFEERVKKIDQKDEDDLTPGVIYLGHIPHGFYENEIRQFFSQFGTVKRLRVSRSKKTARSKGYAFVEFACDEVAKIAAETMDNYLMFGRLLKCKVVPNEKIHPRMWKGADRKFRYIPRGKNEIMRQNKERNKEEHKKHVSNLLKKESRKRRKLKALGIDYNFPGYKYKKNFYKYRNIGSRPTVVTKVAEDAPPPELVFFLSLRKSEEFRRVIVSKSKAAKADKSAQHERFDDE